MTERVTSGKWKSCAYRFFAVASGIVFAFLITEACVRIFVPASLQARWEPADVWQLDPELGWTHKPNLTLVRRAPHQGWMVTFQTNEDGILPATAKREKSSGLLRVLLVGDSYVLGGSVPEEKRLHKALQNLLGSRGITAEVLNAGVEGYSTDQDLIRTRKLVPLYRPDVIIVCVSQNDFGGNVSRTMSGLRKPMFVSGPGDSIVEVPPDMREATIPDYTAGLAKWVIRYSTLYRFLQPEFFILRSKFMGWEKRNMLGLASEMYYRPDALRQVNWVIFSRMLKEMDRTAKANGARIITYLGPVPDEVWEPFIRDTIRREGLRPDEYDRHAVEREVAAIAKEDGIPFCAMIDYFQHHQARGPFHLLPRDPHNNPTGYLLTAEVLAECLPSKN